MNTVLIEKLTYLAQQLQLQHLQHLRRLWQLRHDTELSKAMINNTDTDTDADIRVSAKWPALGARETKQIICVPSAS